MTAVVELPPDAPAEGATTLTAVRSLLQGRAIYVLLVVTWIISWSLILRDDGSVSLTRLLVPAGEVVNVYVQVDLHFRCSSKPPNMCMRSSTSSRL